MCKTVDIIYTYKQMAFHHRRRHIAVTCLDDPVGNPHPLVSRALPCGGVVILFGLSAAASTRAASITNHIGCVVTAFFGDCYYVAVEEATGQEMS